MLVDPDQSDPVPELHVGTVVAVHRKEKAATVTSRTICKTVLVDVVLAMLVVAGCAPAGGPDDAADTEAEPATSEADPMVRLQAIVDDPGRVDEDRARDADRRPAEVLAFFGIAPGMKVAELMASKGYYTELLAAAVGGDGMVLCHNNRYVLERFAEEPLAARLARIDAPRSGASTPSSTISGCHRGSTRSS